MPFDIHLGFEMVFGTFSTRAKNPKVRAPRHPNKRHPFPSDTTEADLSPEILALQRRVRDEKRKASHMKVVRKRVVDKVALKYQIIQWQKAVRAKTKPLQRKSTDVDCQAAVEEDWVMLNLSEVQPVHLAKMVLTGLSPSLLELAERGSLEYTKEEEKALQELLAKNMN